MIAPDTIAARLAHMEKAATTVFALAEIGSEILFDGEAAGDINAARIEAIFSAVSLISDSTAEALEALKNGSGQ